MFWLGMALRELWINRGFSLFFILNLAMGLAGFIAVQSFGLALDRHMESNLKEILTADLVLSASSPLTSGELALADQVLGPDKETARLTAFYTMVQSKNQSKLVRVMAMGPSYPLYGEFLLEKGTDPHGLQKTPGLFMTRDTALNLGIGGDENSPIQLGTKTFFIHDFFREDPDKSLTSVGLAPKIYMGLDQLADTGLVEFGSRIRYFYFYRFPESAAFTNISPLTRKLEAGFFDLSQGRPRINVFDTHDVNRRLGKLTRYFTGYMGMVSIVALFLAGISGAYLFRGLVNLKSKEIAILLSTGAVRMEIYWFVSIQLVVLGTLAALLALGGSLFLMPVFPLIFKGLIPDGLVLALDPSTIFLALAMGMGGSLIFCLPVFVRLFAIRPLALLRGLGNQGQPNHRLWYTAAFVPGITAFFLVSMGVAGSARDGLVFALGFILAMVLLSIIGGLVFWGCKYLAGFFSNGSFNGFTANKIAFQNLFRNKWSSLSCFVTIALGVFLISLIPQVQKGLETEIMRPQGLKMPVFFLVDIQDDQKDGIEAFMAEQGAQVSNISPMVRGRILSVNHQPFFEKHKDEKYKERDSPGRPGRARGRRLEFNFSYRNSLDISETIVQGPALTRAPWIFGSDTPFEISVALSFAHRFGLNIGDILEFDVQGIVLTGKVVNLRKVKWNSFQPNFFLLFQDGVLNDAPKTHLAAISDVGPDQRQALKNSIVDTFPNVSVIDVTQTAATILGVTDRLSLSVRFMAWLAICAGLVSIFSIARHQARKNRNQINLLKVLGMDFFSLQTLALVEFGFIGFTASLSALALSSGFSLAISWYFFDSLWQFSLVYSGVILIFSTGICMVTGLGAVRQVMKTKPVDLLANPS